MWQVSTACVRVRRRQGNRGLSNAQRCGAYQAAREVDADGGSVVVAETAFGEARQQRRLAHTRIADNEQLERVLGRFTLCHCYVRVGHLGSEVQDRHVVEAHARGVCATKQIPGVQFRGRKGGASCVGERAEVRSLLSSPPSHARAGDGRTTAVQLAWSSAQKAAPAPAPPSPRAST